MKIKQHWLAIAAVVLLFVAVVAEHPVFHVDKAHSLIFNVESLIAFCREAAFALLIAYAVSIGIERQARAKDNENQEKMRQQIAQDVFAGVFSKFLPTIYVDYVINSALSSPVVRDKIKIIFEVQPLTQDQASLIGNRPTPLIQLRTTFYFNIRNVSRATITHVMKYYHSNRFMLPDSMCGLQNISFSKNFLNEKEVSDGRMSRAEPHSVSYEWPRKLGSDESVDVSVEGIVLKELSDNEVWACVLPTMATEIVLNNHIPDLDFVLSARSGSGVERRYHAPDSGLTEWAMKGPMLPNESLILWWVPKSPNLTGGASTPTQAGLPKRRARLAKPITLSEPGT
jgi:hypothetical protein